MISKQRLTCCFCAAYVFPCLFKATDLEAICIVVHSIYYARFTHGSSGQKCYFCKWNNLLETKAQTHFCLMHSMTFSFLALSLFLPLAAPVFLVFYKCLPNCYSQTLICTHTRFETCIHLLSLYSLFPLRHRCF